MSVRDSTLVVYFMVDFMFKRDAAEHWKVTTTKLHKHLAFNTAERKKNNQTIK